MTDVFLITTFIVVLVTILLFIVFRFGSNSFFRTKKLQTEDIKKYTIRDLDKMQDGGEFEEYLTKLLKQVGYTDVYKTVGSRDFGADIVFTDSEGFRNVIQAKRYSEKNQVGLSAVQEIYTSMRYYKAKKSMVITTSAYTMSCETLAGVNHVKLIDRKDLIGIIEAFRNDDYVRVKEIIESEPRIIYESWKEMKEPPKEIKADKKFCKELRKSVQ